MKLIPVGIYAKDGEVPLYVDANSFSDDNYAGVEMRKDTKGTPVLVMRSKKTAPLMWKVVYGFSQMYFRTFADAIEFCNSRGMKLIKDQVE
jgi:hypothetical protein